MIIFRLDSLGNVARIHYNNQVRSSRLNVSSAADAAKLYAALATFDRIAYENVVLHRMEAGNLITYSYMQILFGIFSFS